uniref:NADH-ubiquinone oxidoreductase chain 4 n=1 Tax=Aplidium conicum TaxID=286149 RepID=D1GKY7_APLCO|nr:NADH dehydrogenase subunit 4 [Aplidium conicum]CAX68854.1 NADH dehydrogenase subunit 4 [Aplidium conicum]
MFFWVFMIYLVLLILINGKMKYYWFFFYFFMLLFMFMKNIFMTSEGAYSNHYGIYFFDALSVWLIILTFWVILLSMFSMMEMNNLNNSLLFLHFMMMFLLFFFFSIFNMFFFFILFEASLLPIFMIVIFFGVYKQRIFSMYYFVFFTILTTIPLFLITGILINEGVINYYFYILTTSGMFFSNSFILYFSLILGFLSKLPVYGLHMWLPKAHVDAPVGGSMILAGVLLKLGGYGVIRMFCLLDYSILSFFFYFLMALGVFGFFYAAMVCVRILDMKVIIAFSSVSHMSFAFVGCLLGVYISLKGSYLMFLGHGIVSPIMFYIVNLLNKSYGTRLMLGMKGKSLLYSFFLFFSLIFFLFNLGFPPFINFFAEIFVMFGIVFYYKYLLFVVFLGFFFNGIFLFNMLGIFSQSKYIHSKTLSFVSMDYFIFFLSFIIVMLMTIFLDNFF